MHGEKKLHMACQLLGSTVRTTFSPHEAVCGCRTMTQTGYWSPGFAVADLGILGNREPSRVAMGTVWTVGMALGWKTYRERSHIEIIYKLYQYGVRSTERRICKVWQSLQAPGSLLATPENLAAGRRSHSLSQLWHGCCHPCFLFAFWIPGTWSKTVGWDKKQQENDNILHLARLLSSLVVSSTGCPLTSDSFSASCNAWVPIPLPCTAGSTTIPWRNKLLALAKN